MLSTKQKKAISITIKTALVLLCFIYLYYKLSISDISNFRNNLNSVLEQAINRYYLFGVFVLMLTNWTIEAIKWQNLISTLEPISFLNSLKSVLAGVCISLITPNRAGEFAGKLFFLKKAKKADAMLLSMAGSISQVLITFCLGLLALHYYIFQLKNYTEFQTPLLLLCLLIIGLSCYLFLNMKNIAQNWKRGNFIHKIIPYDATSFLLSKGDLLKITTLSMLRFFIFSMQYFLILKIFNLSSNTTESFILIALYFFAISLIPTFALSELGIRGSVAIALFCTGGENCAAVFATSLLLWLINLALPALIGSIFVFQLKFFSNEND